MELPDCFHERLLQLRKDSRLSQNRWSDRTGISPGRVSKLERGLVLPTAQELEAVARSSGRDLRELVAGTDCEASIPRWSDELRPLLLERPGPPPPQWPMSSRLRAAEALNGRLFRRYQQAIEARPDRLVVLRALRDSWTDGPGEVLYWMDLAARGALPLLVSPGKMEFRTMPVLCPWTGRAFQDVPVICWLLREPRVLFFVQVTVLVPKTGARYRLDALTCYERGRWVDVELDGERHDKGSDKFRDSQMLIPTWRFDVGEVQNGRGVELVLERVRGTRSGE